MGNAAVGPNGLGFSTTAAEAAKKSDLTGKTIIVTGCSAGIGVETARALLAHNAHVVMACRNKTKMAEAAKQITEGANKTNPNGKGKLSQLILDLSSLKSVKQFVADFLATGEPLHQLICNAGIYVSSDNSKLAEVPSVDSHFGVNHLAHYALVNLLLPHMITTCGGEGKVVILSSDLHAQAQLDFDDLGFTKRGFGIGFIAYSTSKLANVLFVKELDKKLKAAKASSIHVYSVHPGIIKTELGRDNNLTNLTKSILLFNSLKTVEQGAASSVYLSCANVADLVDGDYYDNCNPGKLSADGKDTKKAEKLWEISEKLTGVSFPTL